MPRAIFTAPDGGPMMARAVLLASLVALLGFSVAAPTASAAECVVGNDHDSCAVSVTMVVCVTEPCDGVKVCAGYGRVCT